MYVRILLLACELRLALLVVRAEAFLRVLALEKLLLQFAFDGQRRLERTLPAALHRSLDAANGARGLVRRAEAPRVLHDAVPPLLAVLLGRPDVVDDAEAEGFFEIEEAAFHHQLDRLGLADQARQQLRSAGSRKHAERDLGQSDFA